MILVTGFEPFGGLARNPSGEAALAVAGPGVRAALLPVDFARIGPEIARLLERPFDAVLLTGVALGRAKLSLERVAINHRDRARADNAGSLPASPEVVPGAPAAYFATIPVDALRDRLEAEGFPAEVSLSAGAYLCNAAFFWARHLLEPRGIPCGFLHLPPIPEIAGSAPAIPLDEEIRALRRLLSWIGGS